MSNIRSFLGFTALAVSSNLVSARPEVHGNSINAGGALPEAAAAYALVDTYDSSNWFDKFAVQNISDPTHGFVTYVDDSYAKSSGLYTIQNNQVRIGVDTTSVLNPSGAGRNSVRIHGDSTYNHALVIADFAHMPGNACGAWPAFWMLGTGQWPDNGEIDIVEGVNLQIGNKVTLHTKAGCTVTTGAAGETGSRSEDNCNANSGYDGCQVSAPDTPTSFGTPFNAGGGGVYATLWTGSAIQIWYWNAASVPANAKTDSPDPATWGTPVANFAGCSFDDYFHNLFLVFDITFCGDWINAVWASDTDCSSINPSCNALVAAQPQSFQDVYWLVNSVKVFSV